MSKNHLSYIKPEEYEKYLNNGKDFIDTEKIESLIKNGVSPDKSYVREIISKSLSIETLAPEETAALINVTDKDLLSEMADAALRVKKRVYDNRIVTFAPIYLSNKCINRCAYCGFKCDNTAEKRRTLTLDEAAKEAAALCRLGHKRTILVYGEHPETGADYIADTMRAVYSAEAPTGRGVSRIRRANVNAAPMTVADYKKINDAGLGTYQVFQETYHPGRYRELHPADTVKGDFRWRLYSLHRAMEAGIDDVAAGALFGLYDWRFEVMGLQMHAIDLEDKFNVGPHTVSFPRMNNASGVDKNSIGQYNVSDDELKRIVTILRLSIPYAGLIVTARENAELRREIIQLGCTQTDASTRIDIGGYDGEYTGQKINSQQFELGDTRPLEDVIREFAEMGIITSFCTAGYRCGRTGDKIMGLLKSGEEGKFCKLNAILTFTEWLEDFAGGETREIGMRLVNRELEEAKKVAFYNEKALIPIIDKYLSRIRNGERDLYV